jgi:hypothetical protein
MMNETQADAGTPRPLTLEWMQASRDHWLQKAIDRKERLDIILAAARAVVEARAKLSFEMEPVEWTDQVFTALLSIDALRTAVERASDAAVPESALLAAVRAVVELWDRWMATSSPDRPSIRDLDAAIDALRPSSMPWYAN